jgi:endo-1,4-beta-xylanase
MSKLTAYFILAAIVLSQAIPAPAALVIEADKAAIHTEGGPMAGGGWNLWSNGQVGQPLRIATAGRYRIVVRAWGSPAGGVWPEMAMLVDGRAGKAVSVGGEKPADYPFDVDLSAGIHEIAAAFLNDAMIGKEDRNLYLERFTISPPAGAAEPVLAAKREVEEAAEKREREIVAATRSAIEKHRKADATIRLVDAAGRPMAHVKVSVEQINHEFLFGCNIFGFDHLHDEAQNSAYKRRFAELFNYATVGFYWRWYETEQGKPNYAYTDKVVAWCREHGIRLKGHPLLWGDEAGVPFWSKGQPTANVQRQRVETILHRYQGKIEFWEVVNEPSHLAQPKIDEPYRWARQADPRACMIVNDYQVLGDGAPLFFKLLTAAKQNDVPFDGIGIQAHEPRMMRFPLDRLQAVLEQYATLGKDLNITEFTPTSARQKMIGGHRDGVWDEAAQADYAVKFYRVCFAQPALRAITWWDLCDQASWLPGGGLLRADLSPKPVYEQLRRLIHDEWHTQLDATTDADGRLTFRGFCGTYRLTLGQPGQKMERRFTVAKGMGKDAVITLAP